MYRGQSTYIHGKCSFAHTQGEFDRAGSRRLVHMVNCMKGKGWCPVVFDPAVVYNTDGTQQSGPEPIEALWPWHGEEPAGGWPELSPQASL